MTKANGKKVLVIAPRNHFWFLMMNWGCGLTLMMIFLKAMGIIECSWIIAVSPLWIIAGLWLGVLFAMWFGILIMVIIFFGVAILAGFCAAAGEFCKIVSERLLSNGK